VPTAWRDDDQLIRFAAIRVRRRFANFVLLLDEMPAHSTDRAMTTARYLWIGLGTLIGLLLVTCLLIVSRVGTIDVEVREMADARNFTAATAQLESDTLRYSVGIQDYIEDRDSRNLETADSAAAAVGQHLGTIGGWQSTTGATTWQAPSNHCGSSCTPGARLWSLQGPPEPHLPNSSKPGGVWNRCWQPICRWTPSIFTTNERMKRWRTSRQSFGSPSS
jgi:hypothetical protein